MKISDVAKSLSFPLSVECVKLGLRLAPTMGLSVFLRHTLETWPWFQFTALVLFILCFVLLAHCTKMHSAMLYDSY